MSNWKCSQCRKEYHVYAAAWHCHYKGVLAVIACVKCGREFVDIVRAARSMAAECCAVKGKKK